MLRDRQHLPFDHAITAETPHRQFDSLSKPKQAYLLPRYGVLLRTVHLATCLRLVKKLQPTLLTFCTCHAHDFCIMVFILATIDRAASFAAVSVSSSYLHFQAAAADWPRVTRRDAEMVLVLLQAPAIR